MAYGTLDYTPARIVMESDNQVEQEMRLKACAKEPWTIAFIEAIPQGDWYIDVGANVGSYVLVAVARGLRVLGIEPAPANFAGMWRNLALNNWAERAMLKCVAVGDAPGWAWFHFADTRPGGAGHTLGPDLKLHHHRSLVPVETLDSLLAPVPGDLYVKIDVDGTERAVLKGAEASLCDPRLKGLMVEIQRENEALVTTFLKERGWNMAQRFDKRGDREIGGIIYGQFQRG